MAPQQIMKMDIKRTLEEKIREINQQCPFLSASIRGSYHHALLGEEEFSDEIDLYIIADKEHLQLSDFQHITESFEQFAAGLSVADKEGYTYTVETRIGPFKPEKERTFQFHLLLDDVTACERIIPTVRLDWMAASTPLLGVPLREVNTFRDSKLTRRMVRGPQNYGSIPLYIKQIQENTIYYKAWAMSNGTFSKQNEEFSIETPHAQRTFVEYCCLLSLKNTIRLFTWPTTKHQRRTYSPFYPSRKNILDSSDRFFAKDKQSFIYDLVHRQAFPPEGNDNAEKAVSFLNYLISAIPDEHFRPAADA